MEREEDLPPQLRPPKPPTKAPGATRNASGAIVAPEMQRRRTERKNRLILAAVVCASIPVVAGTCLLGGFLLGSRSTPAVVAPVLPSEATEPPVRWSGAEETRRLAAELRSTLAIPADDTGLSLLTAPVFDSWPREGWLYSDPQSDGTYVGVCIDGEIDQFSYRRIVIFDLESKCRGFRFEATRLGEPPADPKQDAFPSSAAFAISMEIEPLYREQVLGRTGSEIETTDALFRATKDGSFAGRVYGDYWRIESSKYRYVLTIQDN